MKTQPYFKNVDLIAKTIINPDQVSSHLFFSNESKFMAQIGGKYKRSRRENLIKPGSLFETFMVKSRFNPQRIYDEDTYETYEEPHDSATLRWWMKSDEKRQQRFTLSRPEGSPYAVLLVINETFITIKCSGTLVTERWVLTAAYCFDSVKIVADILIYAGGRSLREFNSKHFKFSQERRSSTFFSHPNYTLFDYNKVVNDIALVKANKPFKLSEYVNTIQLSSNPCPHQKFIKCTVTGFGLVKLFSNDSRDFMRKTYTLSVKMPCKCFDKEKRASAWLCSEPSDDSGVCFGDFGSGLVCNDELVGVTSVLLPMADFANCRVGSPEQIFNFECGTAYMISTFHEIYPYLGWIKRYIHTSRKTKKSAKSGAAVNYTIIKLNLSVLSMLNLLYAFIND